MKAIEGYWRLTDGNEGEEGFLDGPSLRSAVFFKRARSHSCN